MATQHDSANVKDDVKVQFVTREGTYRLLTHAEIPRPNRVGYNTNPIPTAPLVRLTMITLPTNAVLNGSGSGSGGGGANGNGNDSGNGKSGGEQLEETSPSNSSVPNATLEMRGGNALSSVDALSMHTIVNGGSVTEMYARNNLAGGDRLCANFGRELFIYACREGKRATDFNKPSERKIYKTTSPTCHDFNAFTATPGGASLIIGFTTAQIHYIAPQLSLRGQRIVKVFNEERLIDKTRVTCLKWIPNSPNLFLVSHSSGHMYLYNEEMPCLPMPPVYQMFKAGDGYNILTCKSKSTRNPLYKWVFNTENCCINEFCFSPCGANLAIVSQDGFLRVFHYDTMDLLGIARSYFGGFLCVCWSPDGKYIVVGGEDDLVTVWSLHERRVVARGQGHRSWVSIVAFDPYTTSYSTWDSADFSDEENALNEFTSTKESCFSGESLIGNNIELNKNSTPLELRPLQPHSESFRSDASSSAALAPDKLAVSYRLGSVSQDTQICLWDITEDVLRPPVPVRPPVNSTSLNSTAYMNGDIGIDAGGAGDDVKTIRPIAIGCTYNKTGSSTAANSPTKEVPSAEHSHSSSSKFSTANCTISTPSSNSNTPDEVANTGLEAATSKTKNHKSHTIGNITGNKKLANCIGGASKSQDSTDNKSSSYKKANSTKTSNKSADSGFSTFNTLTQRLTNFSFLGNSDKKSATISGSASGSISQRSHRKAINLLKSYNQLSNSNNGHSNATATTAAAAAAAAKNDSYNCSAFSNAKHATSSTSYNFGTLKPNKPTANHHHHHYQHNSDGANGEATAISYDPMKLIGTPACPRFDECPLLEPLVCKKISHERLVALIFREDCFLTACQDGIIYTWARPNTSVMQNTSQQHLTCQTSGGPTADSTVI